MKNDGSDVSSGLQHMNARFYQSSTGRFLSQDRTSNPYAPWTQHLYSYCGNNPINMIDPTGHTIQDLRKELSQIRKNKVRYQKLVKESRVLLKEGYDNKDYEAFEWHSNVYLYYSQKINEIQSREDELTQKISWQNKLNRGAYDKIHQQDFNKIPLFHGSVADYGCGYVAAVIVDSLNGGEVDVYEAHKFFNRPQNELFGTGAIKPSVVRQYLKDKGYTVNIADADALEPNSVYIACYTWKNGWKVGGHYVAYTTDSKGVITPYNASNPDNNLKSRDLYEFRENERAWFYYENTRYN